MTKLILEKDALIQPPKNSEREDKVLEFVKSNNTGVRKFTYERQWNHCLRVANEARKKIKDPLVYEIALCHDLFEDTDVNESMLYSFLIKVGYSQQESMVICCGVNWLTNEYTDKKYPDLNREQRKTLELTRLARSESNKILSIKCLDRIDNLVSLVAYDKKGFSHTYSEETKMMIDVFKPYVSFELLTALYNSTETSIRLNCLSREYFWNKYASEATQKEISRQYNVAGDIHCEDGIVRKVGYIGMTIHHQPHHTGFDKVDIDGSAKIMMEFINWGVEKGYFVRGALVKLIEMPLAKLSPVTRIMLLSYLLLNEEPSVINEQAKKDFDLDDHNYVVIKEGEVPNMEIFINKQGKAQLWKESLRENRLSK